MYKNHTIGVVVPAYNEEDFIAEVVRSIPSYVDRIYAVDDGSSDGTWREIRRLASEEEEEGESSPAEPTEVGVADGGIAFGRRLVPLRHENNRGPGAAIKTGYQRALEEGMDVTATVDGDGQMDTDLLSRLLDPIVDGDAGYAKGNRLANRAYWQEMPRFRLVGNITLSFLTKVASGYWQSMDAQNGFTAISYEALEAVGVDDLYEYYGYCDELLVRLNVHEVRIADVPMPARYGSEISSIRYSQYIPRVSSMLLRNFLWRLGRKYLLRSFHPLVLSYFAGMGSLGLAVIFAVVGVVTAATSGAVLPHVVSALVFLLFAVLFAILAMTVEHGESRHLEVPTE